MPMNSPAAPEHDQADALPFAASTPTPLILDRAAILAAGDLRLEAVPVPEWGGSVYVRELTAAQRDEWEAELQDFPAARRNARAKLAALTVCDANRRLLFSASDVEALGRKSAGALQRVFNAALRLNRVSRLDLAELEGN